MKTDHSIFILYPSRKNEDGVFCFLPFSVHCSSGGIDFVCGAETTENTTTILFLFSSAHIHPEKVISRLVKEEKLFGESDRHLVRD